jgi:hypothetical protein
MKSINLHCFRSIKIYPQSSCNWVWTWPIMQKQRMNKIIGDANLSWPKIGWKAIFCSKINAQLIHHPIHVCKACVNGFTSEECLWRWKCDQLTKHVVWVVTSLQVSYVSVKRLCTKSYVGASLQNKLCECEKMTLLWKRCQGRCKMEVQHWHRRSIETHNFATASRA